MATEQEMMVDLDAADKAGDTQLAQHIAGLIKSQRKPAPSFDTAVAINAANKGIAAVPDMFLNAPSNLLNLGKAGVGMVAGMAGRPDLMPEVTPPPDLARRGMEAVGAIDPKVVPQGAWQKVIDYGVQGATGGALTGGAGLARTAAGAGAGLASGLASGGVAEAGGSPAAQAIAGMVAPQAAPAMAAAGNALAPRLMQSAIKPTLSDLYSGNAQRAARTLLNEGINPTNAGVVRLNRTIEDLNTQVHDILSRSGATVSKSDVSDRIIEVMRRVQRSNPTPQDAMRDMGRVYNQFVDNHLVPDNIPVAQAQRLKQGIYQALREQYGEQGSSTVEAQKALGRGLKETTNAVEPDIVPLNARQGELINARNVAERRALMEGNKNPVGGLAFIAHNPIAGLGAYANSSALIKSLLARGMYSGDNFQGILSQSANQASPVVTEGILADILRRQNQGQQ